MIKRRCYRCMQEYDITLEDLKKANNPLIIDVRSRREYDEGHIQGSINIPEYEIDKNIR